MIRLVVFDLWNTLIRNTCTLGGIPTTVRHELGLHEMDWRTFIEAYDQAFCLKPVVSLESAMEELCKRCGADVTAERKAAACHKIEHLKDCVEPFAETFAALKALKKDGYQLVVLTNTNNPALKFAFQKAPVDHYVDAVIASCEEGLIKPDVRLYARMLQRLRVGPDEALMVGDNVHNDVLAAKAVGMHAVLLDRRDVHNYPDKIRTLDELPDYLDRLNRAQVAPTVSKMEK
ncbi:HAD family hydrolase [Candidatus Micrarchaeota archaeon]|nr:HAD family hydrolase [Candidatus Micrarchaeota archaeon]